MTSIGFSHLRRNQLSCYHSLKTRDEDSSAWKLKRVSNIPPPGFRESTTGGALRSGVVTEDSTFLENCQRYSIGQEGNHRRLRHLLSTLHKWCSISIALRLTTVAFNNSLLSLEQKGFFPGVRDIQEHTFVLELAIEEVKFKSGTLPSAGRSSPTNSAPTHTNSSLSFF
jgi:hypothetical protein